MAEDNKLPLVSVIIPARNEAEYIELCLTALAASDYPRELFEVLLVDGNSQDSTRKKAALFAGRINLKVLNNPGLSAPAGLNIGIRNSRGSVIIRVDGHVQVAPDFISQCVKDLLASGADCVGGPIQTIGRGWLGESIARALSSPFCVGDARFRYLKKPAWVDTLAFGAYRKEVFEKIGLFNEKLIRNQDLELNSRLRKSGGRIFLTPEIKSAYFCRSNFRDLGRQCFQNGYWNILTARLAGGALRWRHFVPLFFTSAVILLAGLGIINSFFFYLLAAGLLLYFVLAFAFAVKSWRNSGKIIDWILLPLLFFWFHFSYGLGSISGIFSRRNK